MMRSRLWRILCLASLLSRTAALLRSPFLRGPALTIPRAAKTDEQALLPLTATPPQKVALLVEPTPFGYVSGYKNRFEEMLKFLKKADDKVMILTADPKPDTAAREFLGYPIRINRGWEFHLYPLVTLTYDFALQTPEIIEELRPDVLHTSSPSAILYPAVLWSWYYEIPLVMSYHTDFVQYGQVYGGKLLFTKQFALWLAETMVRFFHGFADLTLCTSPQLRDSLVSLKVSEKLIDVWQKGINAERFSPSFRSTEMRSRLTDGNPDAPLLIYVGRLGPEKRLTKLKKVLEENPGVRMALVGKGPADHEVELRKLFSDLPVVFTGQLLGDELSAAFASADIFVMPSDSETLGFVVLEAMASGVPVVSVAAGGLIDIVEDGNTGFLASNDDGMEQFTARCAELVRDADKRKAMGAAGRRWAESWSWEAATSKLRNVQYRRAVENHRQANAIDNRVKESLMQQASLFRPDLA